VGGTKAEQDVFLERRNYITFLGNPIVIETFQDMDTRFIGLFFGKAGCFVNLLYKLVLCETWRRGINFQPARPGLTDRSNNKVTNSNFSVDFKADAKSVILANSYFTGSTNNGRWHQLFALLRTSRKRAQSKE
jgi:hypothetical protein